MSQLIKVLFIFLVVGVDVGAESRSRQDRSSSSVQDEVTREEIEALKKAILRDVRSNVQGIFEYHSETGDLNNRLDFWRIGGRVNYNWKPGATFVVRAFRTSYFTSESLLNEQAIQVTAGFVSPVSEEITIELEGGATDFGNDGLSVNALGTLEWNSSSSSFRISGSRTNVEESLLSAVGIRPVEGLFAGRLVGRVMDNRATFGMRRKLLADLDLFADGSFGARTGSNVGTNFFRQANGGVGYNVFARGEDVTASVSLLRASYSLNYFGFEEDRLGFGGVSLLDQRGRRIPLSEIGSDNLSPFPISGNPGVGGYFSPALFLSHGPRFEVKGRPNPDFDYHVSAFIGSQNFTGADRSTAYGFTGTVTFHISERYSFPIAYSRDNFGPFIQQTLYFRLIARF